MIGRARFGVAFGAGAVLGITGLAALTGPSVDNAFNRALQTRALTHDTPAFEPRAAGSADGGFWLSRNDHDAIGLLAGPMTVGDRITVRGQDKHERTLEVVEVRPLGSEIAKTSSTGSIALHMVTCIVVGEPTARPVRFIVEAETPDAPVQPAANKAL